MLSTLDTALAYLRQGISITLSDPKSKRPIYKWAEFQNKLPTEAQIKSMFAANPKAMLAIITGELSHIMVIDCDSPEAIQQVEESLPDSFEPIIAVSPRGGRHYYFACANGKWQTKSAVLKNIDIRANGGVIVAPPSKNDTGGQYRWLTGLDFDKSRLQEMPESLCKLLASAQIEHKPKFVVDLKSVKDLYAEGRRDSDLFHLALALRKSGESREYVLKNLMVVAKSWGEEKEIDWFQKKVESAFGHEEKKERNLAEEIRQWIEETHGDFDYKSCDFDLDLKSKGEKTNRRLVFHRMKKENKIIGIQGKNGWFRRVESEVIYADYVNVTPSWITLEMPLGISNIVKFSPRAIIIVAGSTNAGKTTFLLNIVKANNYKFFYFNSEMSTNKFRGRLDDFGLPVEFWNEKMKMIERVSNIADAIQPNDINIIDYLESDWEKPWLAGNKIREIFDKLDQGIAIIGLQKKRDAPFPRGGEGTLEKAQFAIGLDFKSGANFHTAEILKAKEPATKFNPNFCICDFTYKDNYTTFLKINDWRQK